MGRTLLVLTGEPSGDLAAGRLVSELRAIDQEVRVVAVGGEALRAQGAEILCDIRELGAMGFVEVLRQIPRLSRLEKTLQEFLDRERPAAIVPVDYPGFNLRVARAAKVRGIPVVYYIAPQVWAWGKGRLARIREAVDRLLVVLPFEEQLFRAAGIDAEFVGHPLLEGIGKAPSREASRRALGIALDARVVGILPGSRVQEIRDLLPLQLAAARRVRAEHPELQILVSRQRTIPEKEIAGVRTQDGEQVVEGDAARVITAADVLFVTSGTATLESALLGTPLAVVYRTSPITWFVGKRIVRLSRIGLVNIVAGEELAPEFLQDNAHPELMARWASDLLRDPARREAVGRKLAALRTQFEGKHASQRAARIVREAMARAR
jgi:lipid-A-disaccharide synthase